MSSKNLNRASLKTEPFSSRRELLSLFGAAAVGLSASPLAGARSSADPGVDGVADDQPAVFTPAGVQKTLPSEVYELSRAVFEQRGDFNLDDPQQLALARMKSIFSLDGSDSFVVRFTRALICPPGAPAETILHEVLYWRSFVTRDPEHIDDPGRVVTHSLFTRVAVDPVNYAPRRTLEIPATGQTLTVPDTLFAASVATDLATGKERRRSADGNRADSGAEKGAVEAGATSPYALLGPDVVFFAKGGFKDRGEHQPQVDMSSWATPLVELNDPTTGSATARYSFSGISRARIFSWAGAYGGSPETQVLTHKLGLKSPTYDGLPEAVRKMMERYYPQRI